ncbi:MAG TPA: FAD-binding and (Fe-S)-binding domain-containing protein [Bacteroidota bacterium]
MSTLAWGTDASFYRLIPNLVVKVESEEEIVRVLAESRRLRLPVTFRAAGTSLSGQSLSDSILIVLAGSWKLWHINEDASRITLQPGVVGAHANVYLAPYRKKIGPDPASINSAMIGGIAANNASGMCCGTAQNSYRTIASMRIILGDGSVLDTGDPKSREEFARTHSVLLRRIATLAGRTKSNERLASRIRDKYRMKNTTGYSLNALVDFADPVDIIEHLMIGSEGTLGFIAEVTYNTVPDPPCKASGLILFPDIEAACSAVPVLKTFSVDAVELMDRESLHSVEGKEGMPDYLPALDEAVCSLLVEVRASDPSALGSRVDEVSRALGRYPMVRPLQFTSIPAEYEKLWDIRKGLFPSVGAMRRSGTTVIIEDVAFPVPRLAEASVDLRNLFVKHGYRDAILFGHALDGNLHFVFKQDFNVSSEVNRYRDFIDEVAGMVVRKYDGSLKAEHGTGRNMAPFVELEWGAEAYALMKEIKSLFDPENLINPGVVINNDPLVHLRNLKPLPPAHEIIDKCIECGFCEVQCPSKDLTLTPRQRIVVYREMSRLRASGESPGRLAALSKAYRYEGVETCATDGLCSTACPVSIDTGKMIKYIRWRQTGRFPHAVARALAGNMPAVTGTMSVMLNVVGASHALLGTKLMGGAALALRKLSGNRIPLWNEYLPRGAGRLPSSSAAGRLPLNPVIASDAEGAAKQSKVVYFPSCINRTMGTSRDYDREVPLTHKTVSLLEKAGYQVLFPKNLSRLCCGMAFDSKGFKEEGSMKADELNRALLETSNNGELSVYVDMSPCLYRMRETLDSRLRLYEPVEFILTYLPERLEFRKLAETVAIHTTCSATKMGLSPRFRKLAEMCAERVVVPDGVGCCGWAGDRGFTFPELNASALAGLKSGIPRDCAGGYSTSRTCEIGLSLHSGLSYRSIVYLVDRCTTPRGTA